MSEKLHWHGVFPAITTPFHTDLKVDHSFLARHVKWLISNGCQGIVALGSLGEGATLEKEEKLEILKTCKAALGNDIPLVAGISALSTADAVRLAKEAQDAGCQGLMVLPPYVYCSDWREMKAHVAAIFKATNLSCMLYNNPIAYKTDFLPEQVAELCQEHSNLHAIKESSADVRRVTALRALLGDRLAYFMGVDDLIVEGVQAGATGWIAGLVNAFPKESVQIFELALAGKDTRALYEWFLPLLRLDVVVKFVQLIKLTQEKVDMGSSTVRPPRLKLVGAELAAADKIIDHAIKHRPK
ncbi:MAG: dihydrodipicolinate synthase family protein [Planctomycetia bacterium]|nr:dihydrodipicolinate synthase family protein [Planctomycetia bacterium]